MSEKPTIPAPQYTILQVLQVCLAMARRALEEVRALARIPGPQGEQGPPGAKGGKGDDGLKGDRGAEGKQGGKGDDGKDGRDGLSPDGFTVSLGEDGRTLSLKFACGKAVFGNDVVLPILLDKGVWKEGSYVQGDGVTRDGSFWIAQRATQSKPGTPGSDWRLAVKKGQDGKDFRPDEQRTAAPVRFK